MPPPSAGPPDRPSTVLLGGDAGGSHCTVVIGAADLTVLGRADGPAAAMKPGAAAASAAALVETARRAAGLAGVDLPAERAVIGAAGAGRPQEQAALAAALVRPGPATPAQVAALAPHVLTAAGEGDAVARRAVSDAARELVDLVAALERYFPDAGPIPVAMTGGVLRPQSPLLGAFGERLAAEVHRARLVRNMIDTPVGALKLAAEEQRDVKKRRKKKT